MHTAFKSVVAAVLAGVCAAASAASAVTAAATGTATIAVAPSRSVLMPEVALTGGPALGSDGTMFVMRDPELHIYGPGSTESPKVITGLNTVWQANPSFDPVRGLAAAVRMSQAAVVVIDPDQPAGPAVLTRTIAGESTRLDDVVSVSWAPDGSLWAVDLEIDGNPGIELLRFAPGTNGNVPPVRVITGSATGLADLNGYAGLAVDALSDGSAVVGSMGAQPGVLVFGPNQNGNAAPIRRLVPAMPGTGYSQLGVAADSRGRIYVPMGDLRGEGWGEVAVYPAGATGIAVPALRLTGPTTGLHTVALPAVAPDDGLVVADAVVLSGQAVAVRMLEFDALPSAPSAPRSLRATKRGRWVTFSWMPPASNGGARVTGYTLAVRKGTRTVHTTALSGNAGTYAIETRTLPRGPLTVRITPRNAAGDGPTATTTFAPVVPSVPRSLRAAKRGRWVTFSWLPPASNGGARIARYTLVVTKGTRIVHRVALPGDARAYAIKARRLPRGVLTVKVTAKNAVGRGPTAKRVFRR